MRTLSIKRTLIDVTRNATSAKSLGNNQSPWHSPVPYLFGGLAAMLALIALALLILACSYCRLSSSGNDTDGEEKDSRSGEKTANTSYEEKVLVIMAGEDLPRFIATPAANKCTCGHEGKMVISENKMDKTIGNEETMSH